MNCPNKYNVHIKYFYIYLEEKKEKKNSLKLLDLHATKLTLIKSYQMLKLNVFPPHIDKKYFVSHSHDIYRKKCKGGGKTKK